MVPQVPDHTTSLNNTARLLTLHLRRRIEASLPQNATLTLVALSLLVDALSVGIRHALR